MKTIYFIISFLFFNLFSIYSQVYLELPNYDGDVGSSFTIPVSISNSSGADITSFQFRIYFNDEFLIVDSLVIDEESILYMNNSFIYVINEATNSINCSFAQIFPINAQGILFNIAGEFIGSGEFYLTTYDSLNNRETRYFFDNLGELESYTTGGHIGPIVNVLSESNEINDYKLYQNYPNPFNPATTISFNLAKDSFVSLEIFNIASERIATLVYADLNMGQYQIDFSANNLSSGVYFYRILAIPADNSDTFTLSKKMTLLR